MALICRGDANCYLQEKGVTSRWDICAGEAIFRSSIILLFFPILSFFLFLFSFSFSLFFFFFFFFSFFPRMHFLFELPLNFLYRKFLLLTHIVNNNNNVFYVSDYRARGGYVVDFQGRPYEYKYSQVSKDHANLEGVVAVTHRDHLEDVLCVTRSQGLKGHKVVRHTDGSEMSEG